MDWNGKWIWDSGEESPYNYFLYTRKTFTLQGTVKEAALQITADSRYKLYVNGQFVGRGPIRSHPNFYHYDEYDLTPYLVPGNNVIAVLVHHFGDWTFAYIRGRGGLLVNGRVEPYSGNSIDISTDKSWKIHQGLAWRKDLPRTDLQLPFPETFDAGKDEKNWNQLDFDESRWENAKEIALPGDKPWGNLIPRDIPFLRENYLKPEAVIQIGESKPLTLDALDLDRYLGYQYRDRVIGYAATYIYAEKDCQAEIRTGSCSGLRLWINGEQVVNALGYRFAEPASDTSKVSLKKGWNSCLAKIPRGEMEWELVFEAKLDSHKLMLSAEQKLEGSQSRWMVIGPFVDQKDDQFIGMETVYGPETILDFTQKFAGKHGELGWVSIPAEKVEPSAVSEIMAWEAITPVSKVQVENVAALVDSTAGFCKMKTSVDSSAVIVVDFGREVTGYPRIRIHAKKGGIIDLGGGEQLLAGRVNPDKYAVRNAVRYITRDGYQEWETFNPLAFRYLQIDLRNFEEPVEICSVELKESIYPFDMKGSFECSDPLLNEIYKIGAATVMASTEDTYEDCPWRERGQWWGDARIEALVSYYAFGDAKVAARGLRSIAESQNEEGLTKAMTPGGYLGLLPTFSMIWVISLWDYYVFTGDDSLLKEIYPRIPKLMDWFKPHLAESGLLKDLPYWVFVDWADVASDGESCSVNAFYYKALRSAACIAEAAGDSKRAAEYHQDAQKLQDVMNARLWDEKKGAYIDTIREGSKRCEKYTQHANCLMALYEIAPKDRWDRIFETILNDQDPSVVIAGSPYFMAYVLESLYRVEKAPEALRRTRELYGWMISHGATTWWEQTNDEFSLCHGWSAGPTRDLPAEILGIKPIAPGFAEFEVAPTLLDLRWAKGNVHTEKGDIYVRWALDDRSNFLGLQITVPEGTKAHIALPIIDLPEPQVKLDGKLLEGNAQPGKTVRVSDLTPGLHVIEVGNKVPYDRGSNRWETRCK